jgi:dsRNA-specific ribonuclease
MTTANLAFEVRLKRKLIQLLSPHLDGEDLDRMTAPEALKMFKQGFTHRYAVKSKNYEIFEFLGDKVNAAVMAAWLKKTFPDETRESVFSVIIAKFLSKEKLAEYSTTIGFKDLLIKPPEFPVIESDIEDVFESFMGVLKEAGDLFISEGVGTVLVSALLIPIFIKQGIDPAKAAEYIDAVTLLKHGFNAVYKSDPSYEEIPYTRKEGTQTVTFYKAKVYGRIPQKEKPNNNGGIPNNSNNNGYNSVDRGRGNGYRGNNDRGRGNDDRGRGNYRGRGAFNRGRGGNMQNTTQSFQPKIIYDKVLLAELTDDEAKTSKSRAKEAVSKKALIKLQWSPEFIEQKRAEKDDKDITKNMLKLASEIEKLREQAIEGFKYTGSTQSTKKAQDAYLDSTYKKGPTGELPSFLLSKPFVRFEIERPEDLGDVFVIMYVKNSSGIEEATGSIPVKPRQIGDGARRLLTQYVDHVRNILKLSRDTTGYSSHTSVKNTPTTNPSLSNEEKSEEEQQEEEPEPSQEFD